MLANAVQALRLKHAAAEAVGVRSWPSGGAQCHAKLDALLTKHVSLDHQGSLDHQPGR